MRTPAEFFRVLYGDEPLPGSLVVCRFIAMPSGQKGERCESEWCASIDFAAQIVERWSREGFDVYFGLGLQRGPASPWSRGSAATAVAIPGFAADVDYGDKQNGKAYPPTAADALAIVNDMPLAPTLIIDSGAGLHTYWLFKELWQFDSLDEHDCAERRSEGWGKLLKQKAKNRGYALDSTFDLARVLRPVGSLNYRHGSPRSIQFLEGGRP